MNASQLVDLELRSVMIFPPFKIHEAWTDGATLPTATSCAYLVLLDGRIARVAPCEVEVSPDTYPSLGLSLDWCTDAELRRGATLMAVAYEKAECFLPQRILRVVESDPVGENVTTQFAVVLQDGMEIILRHILPPITLGLDVDVAAST